MIRIPDKEDAGKLLQLLKDIDDSGWMLYDPGERNIPLRQMEEQISHFKNSPVSSMYIFESELTPVGYIILIGNSLRRKKHCAAVVVGVKKEARHKGTASALFRHMLQEAEKQCLQRLELSVIKHNSAAIRLYKQFGFIIEGEKKNSLMINNRLVDEWSMVKLLPHKQSGSEQ